MAFDDPTRNRLNRFVSAARKLLTEEFTNQCQQDYGLNPKTGEVIDLARMPNLDDSQRQTAVILRDTLQHYLAGSPKQDKTTIKATIDRIIREQAFTVLNRLCAVRMAEARQLLIESIGKGMQSKGFQLYQSLAGSGLGDSGAAYRQYLLSLFDEFAVDLAVLFDRFSPVGRLFPGEVALQQLLAEINHPEIDRLWGEDETIGWIYQYFNSQEERKSMRDASTAPRNSRELAVRNQFFTPRYVVEFLTDNTLGRIWYEMTQGRTSLRVSCRYMVRRPDEVFLSAASNRDHSSGRREVQDVADQLLQATAETFAAFSAVDDDQTERMRALAYTVDAYATRGSEALELVGGPECVAGQFESLTTQQILEHLFMACRADRHGGDGTVCAEPWFVASCNEVRRRVLESRGDDLTQEQMLQAPVFMPHRPIKDPRDIKMLDPACGSMHFGLYAFDLFLKIYEEAWEFEETLSEHAEKRSEGLKPLRETYESREQYLADVPRLIIERNIHGIDIDSRAVQIAGLSLWLRAQRAWQEMRIKAHDRPRITKSNIVCAEPMPGEADLLEQFIADHLSQTSEQRTIASIVRRVFDAMKLAGEAGSLLKIEEEIADTIAEAKRKWAEGPKDVQMALFSIDEKQKDSGARPLLVAGIDDTSFWDEIEERIYGALKEYAVTASSGDSFQRRFFAEDAARGFAFIDACRKRYDVVLMNPPFGAFPISADKLLNDMFSACRGDFYPAFIERWNDRSLFLGAITNRTGLSLKGLEGWRQSNLLGVRALSLLGDLGMNVLDALVEAAIYVIRPVSREPLIAIDCLDVPGDRMQARVLEGVNAVGTGQAANFVFVRDTASFAKLPTAPISYKAPSSLIRSFVRFDISERNGLKFRVTSPNYDDFRYLRLKWEVSSAEIGRDSRWSLIAKGGEYAPYCDDLDLLIDWDDKAHSFRGFLGTVHRPLTRPACANLFFSGGLTWSERTASRFSPRILPEDAIFSSVGPYCGGLSRHEMMFVLGVIMSAPFQGLLEMFLAAGDATSSGSAARHYQVGALRNLPFPDFVESEKAMIREGVRILVAQLQQRARHEECNSLFGASCFDYRDSSLVVAINRMVARRETEIERALLVTRDLDELITKRFGIDTDGIEYLASIFGLHPVEYPRSAEMPPSVLENICRPVDEIIRNAVEAGRTGRFITVKSYYIDRKIEVLAHYSGISALSILPYYVTLCFQSDARPEIGESLSSYLFGIAFGRWDIRYATGEQAAPELPDPFAALPVCPPGQLQNSQGLPAGPEDVHSTYPVRIPWDGILVDDPNHLLDIERRVREVIEIIWTGKDGGPTAEAIEHEACEILGVKSLRDYFRKPANFFADHLKRYSKSRRQAPIYWPLSTASGNYTLWIYYHRLTDQTLFIAVNDFVEPKLKQVVDDLRSLRAKSGRSTQEEKELASLTSLEAELIDFRDELLRIAKFWKPNLNDGVQITAAPMWRFFKLAKWQKTLKETWEKLDAGEYDWAHLALSIWPQRVVHTAYRDRSIAIAHDVEDQLWHEVEISKTSKTGKVTKKKEWQPKPLAESQLDAIAAEVSKSR